MYTIIYGNVETLDKYIDELSIDTSLDEFTMRDVQMKLPAIKHKWVGRLMRSKIQKQELIRKKKRLTRAMCSKLIEESPITLSVPLARQKVEQHQTVLDIDDEIKDCEILIEFIEKAERIFNSMTFDIKNLTEIMKLEIQ